MSNENNLSTNSGRVDSTVSTSPEYQRQMLASANRKAAWFWCTGVVLFLGLQLALGASAIYLSKADPSVAVVPEYYQRALDFDETKLAIANSNKLNWSVNYDADVENGISIAVFDNAQNPIALETASVRCYHLANANQLFEYFLDNEDNLKRGQVEISESLISPGRWQFEIDLLSERGERFVQHRQIDVEAVPAINLNKEPISAKTSPTKRTRMFRSGDSPASFVENRKATL